MTDAARYQSNKLPPEEIYEILENICRVEEDLQQNERIQFGDNRISRFNMLIEAIPSMISKSELMEYHKIIRMMKQDEEVDLRVGSLGYDVNDENPHYDHDGREEEIITETLNDVLTRIEASVSSEVFSEIERIVRKRNFPLR